VTASEGQPEQGISRAAHTEDLERQEGQSINDVLQKSSILKGLSGELYGGLKTDSNNPF
jgi:hypothetical protein